ncbi:hypothetical protein ACFPPD_21500 [Cohnella suwonensis]|uniref:Lipoprotein n=1 Tax=Cohnella suwonensis TaxID=696072 RepID=A0ABW0LZH2_9BACL
MKFRMIIFILAIVTVLTGCTNEVESKVTPDTGTVTLDGVTQALEDQGLKLQQIHPKGGTSPFEKLNDVTAVTFAVDSSLVSNVNVYIYVFNSEEARIEGHKDLDELLAVAKILIEPRVYENRNVMVVHFGEKADYEAIIESTIKSL